MQFRLADIATTFLGQDRVSLTPFYICHAIDRAETSEEMTPHSGSLHTQLFSEGLALAYG
jgi:hypothetical protein